MRERSLLGNATSLLICGLLAGVVVAAAAFPAVAFSGLTAKKGSDSFESLPSNLRIPAQPQISYVYAKDGKTLIAQLYEENRKDVSIDDVAPVMQHAMVSAEDTRFYQHHGVDMKGVVRALVANGSSGEVSQGSSTLTMQYVRNVLKTDPTRTEEERAEATQDTPGRKLTEMRYAVALEKRLSKAQILERYLNISYFGHGAYGIYAASETYFSKPPSKLTAPEAAMIAGMVQTPDNDPVSHIKYATERRNYVLGAMVKMGYLGQGTATADTRKPLEIKLSDTPNGCTSVASAHNDWGFFCDYVQQWWQQQKAFGESPAERELNLKQGGYKIITSLDPKVQKEAMKRSTGVYDKNNKLALPMAVVQPGTGRVMALAVNRNYSLAANPAGQKGYPNTVSPLITGGDAVTGYQTGSTFKMFTMLAALSEKNSDGSHKYPLNHLFQAPVQYKTSYGMNAPEPGQTSSCSDGNGGYVYCVKNDNDSSFMVGWKTMWTGFGHSVNTYFVPLEQEVGPQKAVNMAKKLGITFIGDPKQGPTATQGSSDAYLSNNANEWGAFTLGVSATFPLQLANAYATVAAEGKYCAPSPVQKILDSNGKSLSVANPSCKQVLDPDVARAATDAARCPTSQNPFLGSCSNPGTAPDLNNIMGGRQVAGKTGSSENNVTETFAGFTPQVAAAGTAVDPMSPIADPVGGGVSEAVDDAVGNTMKVASEGLPYAKFTSESKAIAFGNKGYYQEPPSAPPSKKATPGSSDHPGGDDHGGGHDGANPPTNNPGGNNPPGGGVHPGTGQPGTGTQNGSYSPPPLLPRNRRGTA